MESQEITRAQKLDFRISQIMTRDVITVTTSVRLAELKEILRTHRISGAPVVNEEGDLVGIISIEDLLRAYHDGDFGAVVGERMTTSLITVGEADSVGAVVQKFQQTGVGRLPVVNAWGGLVGILTKSDITRGLLQQMEVDTQDEEICRYRASHIFHDVESEHTSLELCYTVAPRDFTRGGRASSEIRHALMRLGVEAQIVRRAAIAAYEAEMNLIIHTDHGGQMTAKIDASQVRLNVEDDGPGIQDVRRAL
jgi:CBS domain-containing protein